MSTILEEMLGKRKPFFKRKMNHATQQYEYGRILIGLNLHFQEGTMATNLLQIPLPFLTKDYGFLRFKSFKMPETHGGYKIRCDQMIIALNNKLAYCEDHAIAKDIVLLQLKLLRYIQDDPYDSRKT